MDRYSAGQVKELRSKMTDEALCNHLLTRMFLRPVERAVFPTVSRVVPKGYKIQHEIKLDQNPIGENPVMDIILEGIAIAKYMSPVLPVKSVEELPEQEEYTWQMAVKRKVKQRAKSRGAEQVILKPFVAENQNVRVEPAIKTTPEGESKEGWKSWEKRRQPIAR